MRNVKSYLKPCDQKKIIFNIILLGSTLKITPKSYQFKNTSEKYFPNYLCRDLHMATEKLLM